MTATGTGSSTAPTNAGTYTVVASFTSSNSNYGNAKSAPLTFTIIPATPIVVAVDLGGIYSGKSFPAAAIALGIGGVTIGNSTGSIGNLGGSFTFTYYAGTSVSGMGSSTVPTNAGSYTVVAAYTSGNPNYGNAKSAPATFTINPATPSVVAHDPGGTYSGSTFPATAAATGVGGATVSGSVSYAYYAGLTSIGKGSSTAPTNAGTYTVVASFTSSNSNYGNASTHR